MLLWEGHEYLSDGTDLATALSRIRFNPAGKGCCITSDVGDVDVSLVLPVHSQPDFLLECMER